MAGPALWSSKRPRQTSMLLHELCMKYVWGEAVHDNPTNVHEILLGVILTELAFVARCALNQNYNGYNIAAAFHTRIS